MRMFHKKRTDKKFMLGVLDTHQRILGKMTEVQELMATEISNLHEGAENQRAEMQGMKNAIAELRGQGVPNDA